MNIKIGTCGWGYLNPVEFGIKDWKSKFDSKLQCYASLFEICEVNSTFYKIPKLNTAEKWRNEVGDDFEFTVKASQIITHIDKFESKKSLNAFYASKAICNVLKSKILLIQTPSSFKSENKNLEKVKNFFSKIDFSGLKIAIEPRGFDDETTLKICKEFDLINCVDPFAKAPIYFSSQKIAYFRLHGSPPGKSMYNYKYTDEDLSFLVKKINRISREVREVYVLFNNFFMYKDAMRFRMQFKQSKKI